MPKRISKAHHEYARQALAPGDEFEVESKDIPLLLAIGRIEPKRGEPGYLAASERAASVLPRTAGTKEKAKQIIHKADA
jgi:hypothetical protein